MCRLICAALIATLMLPPTIAAAACVGDCDDSGIVGVNELVRGVAIALGNAPISQCEAFDCNGTGRVTVVRAAPSQV